MKAGLTLAVAGGLGICPLVLAAPPDKSGVKSSVISLPSGPGSIEGLGESFEPQLNTGGSTYGITIVVPAGRAGLQPSVRLGYDSNAGNGLAGLGWSLEFSSIKRQTDKGFPTYTTADTFVFGGEELVPLTDGTWRCENESAFQRLKQIDSDGDGINDAWEVTEKSGTKHTLGRHRGAGGQWSEIEHPEHMLLGPMERTYCWMLDSTTDLHGNHIDYEYTQGPGVLYPARITWNHMAGAVQEVTFQYEARPDAFDDYRPTFSSRWEQRLRGIAVRSEGQLVRTYGFEYAYRNGDLTTEEAAAQAAYVDLGITTLKRVVQYDRSGNTANYLPPLIFTYSGLNPGAGALRTFQAPPDLDLAQQDGKVQLADVDGDGLPDLYSTANSGAGLSQKVCLNRGEYPNGATSQLRFDSEKQVSAQAPADLGIPDTVIQDAKGKGLVDLTCLVTSGGFKRLDTFHNRTSFDHIDENRLGFEVTSDPAALSNAPDFVSYNQPATRLSDVNFDKRSDFVKLEPRFGAMHALIYYVDHAGQWVEQDNALPASYPITNGFAGADGQPNPCGQLADMNGDRMMDLVCVNPQAAGGGYQLNISYWPLCGLGRYGEERTLSKQQGDSLVVPSLEALKDVYVEDFTGDGLADVLFMQSTGSQSQLSLRINLAGSRLSSPYNKNDLPRYEPRAASSPTIFRTADLNANGSTDLLFRNTAPDEWLYLEFLPAGKANLLRGIDNSLGKRTSIIYGTSVEDEQASREAGHPWRTHAPIALQVVRRIITTCSQDLNGDGKADHAVAEFRYRDPFYDGLEREFRGFSFAQRIDYGDDFIFDPATGLMNTAAGWNTGKTPTGQVSGPTMVTRYRFHTGANDQVDNDSYPEAFPPVTLTDEYTEKGGREEEVLKGRQLVEEKLDPWVLHGATDGGFDAGCDAASTAASEEGRGTLTPNAYVYTRAWQTWTIRRLYRPTEALPYRADQNADGILEDYTAMPAALTPAGRFAPDIAVLNGAGRSVSFASAARIVTQMHEANGLLSAHLSYPARSAISTRSTFDYDDYGNKTVQRDYGVDSPGYDDERFITTSYALGGQALTNWIVGQPDTATVTDENGVFVSKKQHLYDGPAFTGLASGQMGARALLHRTVEFYEPAKSIQSSRSSYDLYGNLEETRDPVGNVRRIAWDNTFKTYPVSETIVVGGGRPDLTITAAYDFGFSTVTSSTDFNGNVSTYHYDSFSRLVKIVKPGDTEVLPTLSFDYQPADPVRGQVYAYSPVGALTIMAAARPASRMTTRQRLGVPGEDDVFITVSFIDGCGKKLGTTEEGEAPGTWIVKSATSYNLRGAAQSEWLPFQISSAGVPQFGDFWTAAGRPPATDGTNTAVISSDNFHDATGRKIRTLNPPETVNGPRRFRTVQFLPLEERHFDEEDTLASSPHAGTPMVHYNDGLGRLTAVEEVVKLTDTGDPLTGAPVAWRTAYQYDLNDQLRRITDSQGNVKTMEFDGLKRMTAIHDPDRGAMTFIYDDASNLRETIDAKGQHIAYTYDGTNRIKTEDYQDGGPRVFDVEYFYDAPLSGGVPLGDGGPAAEGVNVKGQLAHVRDLAGETHFSYDSRARLAWVAKRIPDRLHGQLVSYRTAFDYDHADRLVTLTYPDGDQLHHGYNSRSLLTRLYGTVSGDIVPSISYRPSGQLAAVAYGNGLATTYSYDPRQRLTTLLTRNPIFNTPFIHFTYEFDGASNITLIGDRRDLNGQPQAAARFNLQSFTYDNLYRLTRVFYPGYPSTAPGSVDYRYDRIGNMLSQTSDIVHEENGLPVANPGSMDTGGSAGRHNRTGRGPNDAPGPHALTRITNPAPTVPVRNYSYDANGNMLTNDGLMCTWDFKDRLITVENEKMRAEYTYDYTDRRITKTVESKLPSPLGRGAGGEGLFTAYVNKYFELREGDSPVKYVWNGDTRIARVTSAFNSPLRTQFLRLRQGWNLVCLAIGGPQPRLDPAANPTIPAAVYWSAAASGDGYNVVTALTSIPAGVSAWIYSTLDQTLTLTGTPPPAAFPSLTGGSQFVGNFLSERLDLASAFPANAWLLRYDSGAASPYQWRSRYPGGHPLASLLPASDSLATLAPGESLWTTAGTPGSLTIPAAALSIRYYHEDHLGSTSVVTDQSGNLVEETANYAFGHPRNSYKPAPVTLEPYGFTRKERDAETGLHYMEARHLNASLSRFANCDFRLKRTGVHVFLPQTLNSYSYCLNRPLCYADPSGLAEATVSTGGGFTMSDAGKDQLYQDEGTIRTDIPDTFDDTNGFCTGAGGVLVDGKKACKDVAEEKKEKFKGMGIEARKAETQKHIDTVATKLQKDLKDAKLTLTQNQKDEMINAAQQFYPAKTVGLINEGKCQEAADELGSTTDPTPSVQQRFKDRAERFRMDCPAPEPAKPATVPETK